MLDPTTTNEISIDSTGVSVKKPDTKATVEENIPKLTTNVEVSLCSNNDDKLEMIDQAEGDAEQLSTTMTNPTNINTGMNKTVTETTITTELKATLPESANITTEDNATHPESTNIATEMSTTLTLPDHETIKITDVSAILPESTITKELSATLPDHETTKITKEVSAALPEITIITTEEGTRLPETINITTGIGNQTQSGTPTKSKGGNRSLSDVEVWNDDCRLPSSGQTCFERQDTEGVHSFRTVASSTQMSSAGSPSEFEESRSDYVDIASVMSSEQVVTGSHLPCTSIKAQSDKNSGTNDANVAGKEVFPPYEDRESNLFPRRKSIVILYFSLLFIVSGR